MMTTNKVAVLTAAGSGMGADAARRLARDGYKIAVLSSSGKGAALAEELGGIGVTGSNLEASDLAKLVDLTVERWGRIDAVVNSAAHGPKGNITDISDDEWRHGMDVYFLNVVRMTRLVIPHMLRQGGGAIVNISSYGAAEPAALFPTSSVMRAALRNYTKIFSQTYAPRNVRMNNVLPGFIASMEMDADWMQGIAMNRFGEMQEVSALISFLVSESAAYITGQDILIDGGLTKGT